MVSTLAKRALSAGLRRCRVDLSGKYRFSLKDGSTFWLHDQVESHSLWLQPDVEEGAVLFMRRHVAAGGVFVDIGANVGRYTIPAARLVGAKGLVYAFEPTPAAFAALSDNVTLNGLQDAPVHLHHVAVADSDGPLTFWDYGSASHLSGLRRRDLALPATRIEVQAITGHTLLRMIGRTVDLMKIDVEGFELPILGSFGAELATLKAIIFECSRANFARAGYSIRDMLAFLFQCGRRVYQIQPDATLSPIVSTDYDVVNENLLTTTLEV